MKTCFDILGRVDMFSETSLRPEDMNDWVLKELKLGFGYRAGEIPEVSRMEKGCPYLGLIRDGADRDGTTGAKMKAEMMLRLDEAFEIAASEELQEEYFRKFRVKFEEMLENPGLLRNFEYFMVPDSEMMLIFYLNILRGKDSMANVMECLHDDAPEYWTRGLSGQWIHELSARDPWTQMSQFEAMNVDKRDTAAWVAKELREYFQKEHDYPQVLALAGGNLPERHYGLPPTIYTAFDTSPGILSKEELFPGFRENDDFNRKHLDYYADSMFRAAWSPYFLRGTQDFVTMEGISMYLDDGSLCCLLEVAESTLRPGGAILMDFLVMTDSMKRVGNQGWAISPAEMQIAPTAKAAEERIKRVLGRYISIAKAARQESKLGLETLDTNVIPPWGAQSVKVKLVKRA
ncbi:hypothetical protein IKE71_03370 [Candidatus Saccharibacteria bacterium]|nr:hypothetical protein [Candidatus Saccharibacteria bacterium]